jgi:acylphosphatase
MKKRVHIIIKGRVQGVFFRANTAEQADTLGLTGWVKNTFDGNVEAVFEGDEASVNEMVAWCRKGPPLARVTDVQITTEPYAGEFTTFSIRFK